MEREYTIVLFDRFDCTVIINIFKIKGDFDYKIFNCFNTETGKEFRVTKQLKMQIYEKLNPLVFEEDIETEYNDMLKDNHFEQLINESRGI